MTVSAEERLSGELLDYEEIFLRNESFRWNQRAKNVREICLATKLPHISWLQLVHRSPARQTPINRGMR